MFILYFRPFSGENRPTMYICLDCQRTNAPWAKKCTACGADLHAGSSSTLIAKYPDALDNHTSIEHDASQADTAADIKSWSPDTEWHSLDEIDGEKVLNNETIEPISVIEPSRTAEIDWGNSREDSEKFDSRPIQADSKNRFDEYGYDFEKANKSAWKSTAILLSGVFGILTAGGLAIGYLHSTTIPTLPNSTQATTDKNGKVTSTTSAAVTHNGMQQRNPSDSTVMTEEVISVTRPLGPATILVNTEKQNTQLNKGSNTQQEPPAANKPPVFVMSASEPIMAKPEGGKIATSSKKPDPIPTIIEKQAAVVMPAKPTKPLATKSEARITPYPVLVAVPLRPNDGRTQPNDSMLSEQNEPARPLATAPTQVSQSTTPSRLKDKQSSECSNSAFLGKVLCEERSRVNFCSNRWNAHPDCQLNNTKLEP
jgi:hypothetical protein